MPANRSAKIALIEEHYAGLHEQLTWTGDRLNRLCAAAQVTPEELAALIRFPATHLLRSASTNRFSPTVALHLTLIENWVFRLHGHRKIFPDVLTHD